LYYYLDPILKQKKDIKSVFEFGCGNSTWLSFLAKNYNLFPSGIDYSEVGCKLASKNLFDDGIKEHEIYLGDFLQWESSKSYDVIISLGVIEHFTDMKKMVKMFSKHLNSGGVMITMIPNYHGIWGTITKRIARDIYDIHNIASLEELKKAHEGLEIIVAVPFYPISVYSIILRVKAGKWLHNKVVHKTFVYIDVVIRGLDFLLFKCGIRIPYLRNSFLVIASKQ
jgi:SAM-dependent methyltransferase